MGDLGERSRSQVLRGYLPQQTQDLKGGIYRVTQWSHAVPVTVDEAMVRRQLARQIAPFEAASNDSGIAVQLRAGASVEVIELPDEGGGVQVERFPRVWLCQACRRVAANPGRACRCGTKRWGQLHFVGVHTCGYVDEPRITRCPVHDDVQLVSPKSAKAQDIRFVCPTCQAETMKGLGFRRCPGCEQGTLIWNVHKARTVYAPHGSVIVNAPRPGQRSDLLAAGGGCRTLEWVVGGLQSRTVGEHRGRPSRTGLLETLQRQGLTPSLAADLADAAAARGEVEDGSTLRRLDGIPADLRQEIEDEAVDIAIALSDSRVRQDDISDSFKPEGYAGRYRAALEDAALHAVDLVEQFPVLTFMYGYTRGGADPAKSRLIPFRSKRGGFLLHGELSPTEAFYVQFDPVRVAGWLADRGFASMRGLDRPEDARLAILAEAEIPQPGRPVAPPTVGSEVTTLVHSMAHRFIRHTSAYAGIDRDALSEYLVPRHLGFFVYAAAKGDFVLGGLQALYEGDMDALLRSVRRGEYRCPLDPGCSRGTEACPACLHIGEPSCRGFNTMLSRSALFGSTGYWRG